MRCDEIPSLNSIGLRYGSLSDGDTFSNVKFSCPSSQVVVSPVLAGLAVAIGVPILLFYVYGVVPVSLCRAGCGEGTKFEFDEEEDNGSRNHGWFR